MHHNKKEPPPDRKTELALKAANKEIERLKKLIDKRIREIKKLRKRKE